MSNKLKRIIVVDLEITAWDGLKPEDQEREIVEIGACNLWLNSNITDSSSYLIKPKRSAINDYFTNLTGINKKMLKGKHPFKETCNKFIKDFHPKNSVWGSWGISDKLFLEKECDRNSLKIPFSEKYIDIQLLFSLKYEISKNISLVEAMKFLDIEFEGEWHRAVYDAYNTAKILRRVLWQK